MGYEVGSSVIINGRSCRLDNYIAEGGEGVIFETNAHPDEVIKIYKAEMNPKTTQKIKTYVNLPLGENKNICGPHYPVFSINKNLIGFTMYKSKGHSLDYMLSEYYKKGSRYTRRDLINLCVNILSLYNVLYELKEAKILLGDINLDNIMVDGLTPYLIDMDSIQLNDFHCPVGKPDFTPARMQGIDFDVNPRTYKDESFPTAVLLFEILFCRKHPASHVGGGDIVEDIAKAYFPYKVDGSAAKDAPIGFGDNKDKYTNVWSYLPEYIRQAFCSVFSTNDQSKWPDCRQWLPLMKRYQSEFDQIVKETPQAAELWPRQKAPDRVKRTCKGCGKEFVTARASKEKYCPDCLSSVEVVCSVCQSRENVKKYETLGGRPYVCTRCRKKVESAKERIDSLAKDMCAVVDLRSLDLEVRLKDFEHRRAYILSEKIEDACKVDALAGAELKAKLEKLAAMVQAERFALASYQEKLLSFRFSYEDASQYKNLTALSEDFSKASVQIHGKSIALSALPIGASFVEFINGNLAAYKNFISHKNGYQIIAGKTRATLSKADMEAEYNAICAFNLKQEEREMLEKGRALYSEKLDRILRAQLRRRRAANGLSTALAVVASLVEVQMMTTSSMSWISMLPFFAALALALLVFVVTQSGFGKLMGLVIGAVSTYMSARFTAVDLQYAMCWMPIEIAIVVGVAAFLLGFLLFPLRNKPN